MVRMMRRSLMPSMMCTYGVVTIRWMDGWMDGVVACRPCPEGHLPDAGAVAGAVAVEVLTAYEYH